MQWDNLLNIRAECVVSLLRFFFFFFARRQLNPTNDCCVWLTSSPCADLPFSLPLSFVYIEHKRTRKISKEDTFIYIWSKDFVSMSTIGKEWGGEERGGRRYSSGHTKKKTSKSSDVILKRLIRERTRWSVYLSIFVLVISEVNNLSSSIEAYVCLILFHMTRKEESSKRKEEEEEDDVHKC